MNPIYDFKGQVAPAASFVIGVGLPVDGGFTAH
jgi:hypothetical protein